MASRAEATAPAGSPALACAIAISTNVWAWLDLSWMSVILIDPADPTASANRPSRTSSLASARSSSVGSRGRGQAPAGRPPLSSPPPALPPPPGRPASRHRGTPSKAAFRRCAPPARRTPLPPGPRGAPPWDRPRRLAASGGSGRRNRADTLARAQGSGDSWRPSPGRRGPETRNW